jgi:hypothetical protein
VNGRYQTYPRLVTRFPAAHVLGIAVDSRFDAECLDVEPGDATNATAPGWVKRQLQRGVKRPVVYTSVSNAHALLTALAAEGIKREEIRLWTAHYTFRPHLCDAKCGFGMPTVADATQYHDHALARNLDASLVQDTFFALPKPAPSPKPKPAPSPVTPVPHGEPKNQPPFHRLWPVPVPHWFWTWAQWRKDGQTYARPADAPRVIPAWAWVRLAAL